MLSPNAPGEAGEYEFLYKASATECTEGSVAPESAGIALGLEKESVSVELTGLSPGTQYTFCVFEKNAAEETAMGSPVTFRTQAVAPTITGSSAIEVTATSARLQAQVNPGGGETTYHFDYGLGSAYEQSTPESGSIGADDTQHTVTTAIQGLEPGTTYHYRLVATSSQSPAGGTLGPDETFTTQTTGGEFTLPDGRSWELVSPPQKDGAEILGIGGGGQTAAGGDATQASENGASVSYIANAPIGENPPGNSWSTQIFSIRGPDGWSSQNISPPHTNPVGIGNALEIGEEFVRFSPDLSHAIVMSPHQKPEPPLAPEIHQEVAGPEGTNGAPFGHEIYLRDNTTGAFRAVLRTEPLPEIAFEGASPGLSHVVFEGPAGLDPKYPSADGLYEWFDGNTQLVSVLPSGVPASGQSLLGRNEKTGLGRILLSANMHAISDDGSRIVWSNAGDLFTSDTITGETTTIGPGAFKMADNEGSRVFYTDGDHLFVFDILAKTQVDLGNSTTVFGANEEGTLAYDISTVVLTSSPNEYGEQAVAGVRNVYLLREAPVGSGSWTTIFVAAGQDEGSANRVSAEAPLTVQAADVSPNGRYLAFMSRRSLTGYDNSDVNSGEPDEEIYLYDAEANRLVCSSCDPTGARPVGQFVPVNVVLGTPLDPWRMWEGHWLAATIPGWTPDGGGVSTGYQPRYLSDSGRLFFDSSDALVPQDIDGTDDVYQYEPAGVGSCQPPAYGGDGSKVFSESEGGCVGLISAGSGSGNSVFFDASANGNDVFFTTQDGLVSQDKDGTADMYDARVCTHTEPCLQSLASGPACSTADSCRAAPSPQPGVFAAPASATFAGAGNLTLAASTTVKGKAKPKTAAQVRAERLVKALKACKGKPKGRRHICEARARKRYGKAKTSGRRIK